MKTNSLLSSLLLIESIKMRCIINSSHNRHLVAQLYTLCEHTGMKLVELIIVILMKNKCNAALWIRQDLPLLIL